MSPKLIPAKSLREPPFAITINDRQLRRLEETGEFPRRVKISARRHGYVQAEVEAFIVRKINERDGNR